jgi:hypothetical protein
MTTRKPSAPARPKRYWDPWHFIRSTGMAQEIEAIRRYITVVTAALDREFAEFTEKLGRTAESADEQDMDAIGGEIPADQFWNAAVTHGQIRNVCVLTLVKKSRKKTPRSEITLRRRSRFLSTRKTSLS